jgi:hypothetical protein
MEIPGEEIPDLELAGTLRSGVQVPLQSIVSRTIRC